MDLVSKSYANTIRVSQQALSPITTPGNSILGSHSRSSGTSFPIIAIAVIGILATGFLLVSYYIFVIKCCLNWHRIDLLRRFSLSRRQPEDTLTSYSPAVEHGGLDESVIRSIPIFQFKNNGEKGSSCECAVCLNEFKEDEKLRRIPNCSHVFHIDCIDVWLQSNANCPLCRESISSNTINGGPSSTQQDPRSTINGDEDYVVIELGHSSIDELSTRSSASVSPPMKKQGRKLHKGTSMGDEWIDTRDKNKEFAAIQPIRRSISMDSSADRQLYLAVQEAMRQNRQVDEVSPIEGFSSRVVRRSFFSFGHGRGSKNAVLPVYLEP
ncbi:RING-H2 finger protein ATL1 [Hibiscus syriacus]|uniref:RING-type E3 ubiquitin transferase n=1 Tax=Hibiscus syriacus TaxID=106335 RepID=A0A6A3BC84_HIBSY|nr:RING-H2 finger protein ATL1-like [Hibiscus syriacus]KAE8714630.1 RING-H2 finger protein ATL1 [Hibiscus syriacus]